MFSEGRADVRYQFILLVGGISEYRYLKKKTETCMHITGCILLQLAKNLKIYKRLEMVNTVILQKSLLWTSLFWISILSSIKKIESGES